MRLPNGYGGVIKLSGKRRRPYAARITAGVTEKDGKFVQQYKYIGYFAKRAEAVAFLADYNKGTVLPDNQKVLSTLPTFAEVYELWKTERQALGKFSAAQEKNYRISFNHFEPLHNRRFATLRHPDLQDAVLAYSHKSKSTITFMLSLLHGMYKYALRHELVDKDYSAALEAVYSPKKSVEHIPFTDEEIALLWAHSGIRDCYLALIMIYTGMRCSELLTLRTENIHLDERYMIGGLKTKAGTDRVIPIAEKLVPFFEKYMDPESVYFYPNSAGKQYDFSAFNNTNWKNLMAALHLEHRTHDCRHTFATLSARAGISDYHRKLIMGHTIKDLTNGTYTHVSPAELVEDINKL